MSHTLFACDLFSPSHLDSFIFLMLTRLVVVLKFINFRFALFTPPPSRRLSPSLWCRGGHTFYSASVEAGSGRSQPTPLVGRAPREGCCNNPTSRAPRIPAMYGLTRGSGRSVDPVASTFWLHRAVRRVMVIKHLDTCEISGRGTTNNDAVEVKELLHPRVNPLKTKADDGGPRGGGRCGDTQSESEMLAPQAHATMRGRDACDGGRGWRRGTRTSVMKARVCATLLVGRTEVSWAAQAWRGRGNGPSTR
jgi:hypothetical protein